jgi:hypothetical protein
VAADNLDAYELALAVTRSCMAAFGEIVAQARRMWWSPFGQRRPKLSVSGSILMVRPFARGGGQHP